MRRLELTVIIVGAVALALSSSAPVLAGGSASGTLIRPPAPAVLINLKAIKTWAESTSWGGAEVDTFEFSGHEVVVVRRSFSSGVETCGLTAFVPIKRGWVPCLNIDVSNVWLTVNQDGDSIHVTTSSKHAEIARFSIAELQANKALQTDGASRRR